LAGFVYSVGLPPPSVAAARSALDVLRCEPERLGRLASNSRYFLRGARKRGPNVGTAIGMAVVPVLLGETPVAINAGGAALAEDWFVPRIVQIAVPKNAPRLRFFITAGHEPSEIDGALDVLAPFAVSHPFPLVDSPFEINGDVDIMVPRSQRKSAAAEGAALRLE
jgi:7-keto-8-aminopelargonate synthetase-like enzyme